MTALDRSYIKSLIKDIRVGDSDAFAGLFAATYQDQYRQVYARLHNEYETQDVLQKTYSMVLNSNSYPAETDAFINVLNHYSSYLCDTMLKKRTEKVQPKDAGSQELDEQSAQAMLDYILASNHWNPSSFSLETLASYSTYRKSRSTLQKVLAVIVLALLCMVPIAFIPPSVSLAEEKSSDNKILVRATVQAIAPIHSVTATIDGKTVQVSLDNDGTYIITPTANGQLVVTATLSTYQKKAAALTLTDVDVTAPAVTDKFMKNGVVYLYLSDTESGIDFDSIYAVTDDGTTIKPSTINVSSGEITFPKPDGTYNVYISDYAGNKLHLLLRVSQGTVTQP